MTLDEFRRRFRWKCRDGRVLRVDQIKDQHLANIVNYLLQRPLPETKSKDRELVVAMFHLEAERRGLTRQFLEAAPYESSEYSERST